MFNGGYPLQYFCQFLASLLLKYQTIYSGTPEDNNIGEDMSTRPQSPDDAETLSDYCVEKQSNGLRLDNPEPTAPQEKRDATNAAKLPPHRRLLASPYAGPCRSILVVWHDRDPTSDAFYKHWTETSAESVQFLQATDVDGLLWCMATLGYNLDLVPKVMLIADAGIFRKNRELTAEALLWLRLYVFKGGILILAVDFGMTPVDQMNDLFRGLGRTWKAVIAKSAMTFKNGALSPVISGGLRDKLTPIYFPTAMFLAGVKPASQLYVSADDVRSLGDEGGPFTCPVVWEKSGAGRFGFVGDVAGHGNSWRIILAMCGM